MNYLPDMPDNAFELAICDPPYGNNVANEMGQKSGQQYGKAAAPKSNYIAKDWDLFKPTAEYFKQLFRVSKNQIIWGGNYFLEYLGYCKGPIIWDKQNDGNQFADGELAWSSFNMPMRFFRFMWNGMLQEHMGRHKEMRIHPTQKPVKLYEWLLKNYAEEGDKIIDTHFGSLSIGCACHNMGHDLTAFEIDKDYFEAGKTRLEEHQKQGTMF